MMRVARKKVHRKDAETQRITEMNALSNVTPAKAGVHIPEAEVMDPGFRRGDIEFSIVRVNRVTE